MKKYLKIIIYLVVFILWIIFIFSWDQIAKQNSYELSIKYTKELYIPKGVVVRKYIDSSYGMRGARFLFVDYVKYGVRRRFFDIIKVGDTIQKNKNSMLIIINGREYNYLNH